MDDDYIFTTNGFRKVTNNRPMKIRLPPAKMTSQPDPGYRVRSETPGQSLYRSNTMNKYRMHDNKEKIYPQYESVLRPSSTLPYPTKTLTRERVKSAPQTPLVYTVRNPDCTPSHMYLHEDIRFYAKQRQKENNTPSKYLRRRAKSANVAYRFEKPIRLPDSYAQNEHLTSGDLTMGQKQYIWGIARCYSSENLKKLNHRKTQNILDYEFFKRVVSNDIKHTVKMKLLKEYIEHKRFFDNVHENGFASKCANSSKYYELPRSHHERLHQILGDYDEHFPLRRDSTTSDPSTTIENSFDCVVKVDSCESSRKDKMVMTENNSITEERKKRIQRPKSAHPKNMKLIQSEENDQSNSDEELLSILLTRQHISTNDVTQTILNQNKEESTSIESFNRI